MDIDELTRQGKNMCPKCNKPMDMYYRPWCPRCDKPQLEQLTALNFIQCLEHLEAIGHIGIQDRVWEFFKDEISNDSYFQMFFPAADEKEDYEDQHYQDLMLIKNTWNLDDSVLMEVSW